MAMNEIKNASTPAQHNRFAKAIVGLLIGTFFGFLAGGVGFSIGGVALSRVVPDIYREMDTWPIFPSFPACLAMGTAGAFLAATYGAVCGLLHGVFFDAVWWPFRSRRAYGINSRRSRLFIHLVCIGFVLLLAFYYGYWSVETLTPPNASDVQSMTACMWFDDRSKFTVPPEHFPKILAALRPAIRERLHIATVSYVTLELEIVFNDGRSATVRLYSSELDRLPRTFTDFRTPRYRAYLRQIDGPYFSPGPEYYGKTDPSIADAIQAAYESLQTLDLTGRQVTDAGLKELAGLMSLQGLNLSRTRVTDAGLKELAGLMSLQRLDLRGTRVTDAGLKELAGLKSLQSLDLGDTQVTDAGLKELAGLNSLQMLNLAYTQVTDAGLKELAGLKSLQWLNLDNTKVTNAGVKDLQRALPGCVINR